MKIKNIGSCKYLIAPGVMLKPGHELELDSINTSKMSEKQVKALKNLHKNHPNEIIVSKQDSSIEIDPSADLGFEESEPKKKKK